jgi:hypothetical protein
MRAPRCEGTRHVNRLLYDVIPDSLPKHLRTQADHLLEQN